MRFWERGLFWLRPISLFLSSFLYLWGAFGSKNLAILCAGEIQALEQVIVVVQWLSCAWLFATPWTAAHRTLLSFISPRVCSNSCLLSQWCCLTISTSATLFSFCLQSFPALGSFPMNWLFVSDGQSIEALAKNTIMDSLSFFVED